MAWVEIFAAAFGALCDAAALVCGSRLGPLAIASKGPGLLRPSAFFT